MGREIWEKLQRKFTLEKDLLEAEQRLEALEQELPEYQQASWEGAQALREYETGGLKRLLDRMSGKWEERREFLSREARRAVQALETAQREKAALEEKSAELGRQLGELGDLENEFSRELEEHPQYREQLRRQKAYLLARRLLPRLEETDRAMKTAQKLARGDLLEDLPWEERSRDLWLGRAEPAAGECRELLEKLADCDILLEIHPYFENPAWYIRGVTKNTQLDRLNHALDALWDAKHQIKELLLQLSEEE